MTVKKLKLLVSIGISALLSGCACECADEPATIYFQFYGFTTEELKTIYVVNSATPDTLFNWVDVLPGNSSGLWVLPNTRYQLKSDSIPLDKVIQVKDIKSETTKRLACDCTYFLEEYEYDGHNYTSETVVIAK